ncbi:hypothetical protein DRW42_07130 [Pedobacter miscanthi]|uniref:Uncharacterized protein n=1 Tax=Pedobacter miscanthi TaxID=2259170 RepID=A0A366L6R0_9SPHI|nr:hypothetical protein DRW42_07130 [Pedobacter miscanthi]
MFPAVSVAKGICERYRFSFRTDISGSLIFDYNSGESEHFGENVHLVPLNGGFWSSRLVDLNIISHIYICSSAMEAIAFIHFNSSRFSKPDGLLFIAISSCYNYPESIVRRLGKVRVNLVLGNDLIDNLRAIKFCMDYKGIQVQFLTENEQVVFKVAERCFSLSQPGLSLRRFFLLAKIRPFFRQYIPKSKISFLHEFLNQ